jgi:hypothetical protein
VKNLAVNMVLKNVKFFFTKHKKFTTIAKLKNSQMGVPFQSGIQSTCSVQKSIGKKH